MATRESPAVERLCRIVAIVGCAWFAFTAWWGVGAIPGGGHLGAGAAGTTMMAENSIRWHTIYPLFDWWGVKDPYPASAYCHHPFGMYWLSAIAVRLFGHRDFIVALPAAIMSTATPPLLYKTAKLAWGAIAGAAAVVGFVLLPITVGYSIFHNLEVLTIFGVALFFFGHVRWQAWGRRRDLAWSLCGALFATAGDWVGYLVMGPLLAWGVLRAFVLPAWMSAPLKPARYHRWWALSVSVAVVTLAFWVALFQHVDKIGDWLGSAEGRGGGSDLPLKTVLESRKVWIDFSFTPVAIAVGKLGAWVALARFVWRRTDEEILSLSVLFGAVVQYVVFKRGADVHIFWPHYFGAYYAFALAQLAVTVRTGVGWAMRHIKPTFATSAAVGAGLAVVLFHASVVGPDSIRSLKIWRETGGRYDDKGSLIRSHVDMLSVLEKELRPYGRPGAEAIGVHSGAQWGWEHAWAYTGPVTFADEPSSAFPFWVARASGMGGDHLARLAKKYRLRIFGDVVMWKRGDAPGSLDAYSLGEREPNLLEWMFRYNVEPVRQIGDTPDPFLTWEWRYHLDQPATPPATPPKTIDELRIAHNVAVSAGDAAGAERLREQLVAQIDRRCEAHYEGGHELMGVRVTDGVKPSLEVYFRAGGPTSSNTTFQIRSVVTRKLPSSLIPVNPVVREMAFPPPLSTMLWKEGFIYVFTCPLYHRIGYELYTGTWAGGPARRNAAGPVNLVELP